MDANTRNLERLLRSTKTKSSFRLYHHVSVTLMHVIMVLIITTAMKTTNLPSANGFFHETHSSGTTKDGDAKNAYLDWHKSRGRSKFAHSHFLQSVKGEDDSNEETMTKNNGIAMYWSIVANGHDSSSPSGNETDHEDDDLPSFMSPYFHLAIVARATGWVGWGISENGGMRGADIVYFEASNPNRLTDAHVLDGLYPMEDECHNWDLLYSQTHDGFLIFEAARLLNTFDPQDRRLINDTDLMIDPTKLIAAWGDGMGVSYHGPSNVAKTSIRLFSGVDEMQLFHDVMATEAEGSFVLAARDYVIPSKETTYAYFCFDREALEDDHGVPLSNKMVHLIGVEPLVDPRSAPYVHHFTLTSSKRDEVDADGSGADDGSLCKKMSGQSVYGWTPGVLPMLVPLHLGSRMGGTDGFNHFVLEVHYNNPPSPNHAIGQVDSSGVRVYWTSSLRPNDAAGFFLADPLVKLHERPVVPINDDEEEEDQEVGRGGLSKHTFSCPASCTTMALSVEEPITVYKESFHMHQAGMRASNIIRRNGEIVHWGYLDFWDFRQSGQLSIQQDPFVVLPGDTLETTCYFDSPQQEGEGQLFGYASSDEMCMASMSYYPQRHLLDKYSLICSNDLPLPACKADYNATALPNGGRAELLQRQFGRSPSSMGANEEDDGGGGGGFMGTCLPKHKEGIHFSKTQIENSDGEDGEIVQNETTESQVFPGALGHFWGINQSSYLQWLEVSGSRFDHRVFMKSVSGDDSLGVALHWSIVVNKASRPPSIEFAVVAHATGWVGFGISENGGMRGADLMVFETGKPDQLMDAFVLDSPSPIEDDCQNWELLSSQATPDGFIIVEASRPLDTGDGQDRKLINDTNLLMEPTKLIAAWGDSPYLSQHSPKHVAKARVRLFRGQLEMELFRDVMLGEAEGSFVISVPKDFEMSAQLKTMDHHFCFYQNDLRAMGLPISGSSSIHIIGVEPVMDGPVVPHVHHMSVAASYQSGRLRPVANGSRSGCEGTQGAILYGWAPGVLPLLAPLELGVRVGGEDGFNALDLGVHFVNPDGEQMFGNTGAGASGSIVGVRLHWTSRLRRYDAGFFFLADPFVSLRGSAVGDELSMHTFDCPSSCTLLTLTGDDPITVYKETFYMHRTGVRATNIIYREGKVVHESSVEFWDYAQNGQLSVQQEPFQLFPGDSIRTTCYYDSSRKSSTSTSNITVFGFSSDEEICMASFGYYSASLPSRFLFDRFSLICSIDLPIHLCDSQGHSIQLTTEPDLGRAFGGPSPPGSMKKSLGSGDSVICLPKGGFTIETSNAGESQGGLGASAVNGTSENGGVTSVDGGVGNSSAKGIAGNGSPGVGGAVEGGVGFLEGDDDEDEEEGRPPSSPSSSFDVNAKSRTTRRDNLLFLLVVIFLWALGFLVVVVACCCENRRRGMVKHAPMP